MIERCTDYRIIKRAMGRLPIISNEIIYLNDNGNIWTFEKATGVMRVHANMVTNKGKAAIESAKSAFKWIFENTDEVKIEAEIENTNKAAKVIAQYCMSFISNDGVSSYYEVLK